MDVLVAAVDVLVDWPQLQRVHLCRRVLGLLPGRPSPRLTFRKWTSRGPVSVPMLRS